MAKTLKILILIFALCLLILLTLGYFYEKHPDFKTYIDQSLISSIPYLWDLIIHLDHYHLKVEWVLYGLLATMVVLWKTGFIGVSQYSLNGAAKMVRASIILLVLFLIAMVIIYFWPSNSINLVVFQFNKGSNFFGKYKYIIDVVIICYLYFFIFTTISAVNHDVIVRNDKK